MNVLFPSVCLNCKQLVRGASCFCLDCFQEFRLLSKEGHCTKCFAEISMLKGTCLSCRKKSSPFRKLGVCFDSFGPGKSLLTQYENHKTKENAKNLAAYFILQAEKLEFPPFQIIIDLPRQFSCPFALVAKEIAKMWQISHFSALKKRLKPYPLFSLKKKCNIINKRILLLGAELDKTTEMEAAGLALKQGWPEIIYGMTFCATLH